MIRIWIDDVRPAPDGYVWCKSVDESKEFIIWCECTEQHIELINIDHDAGDFACDGGDYIEVLNWLEETGRNYPIRIHSMNVVGRENMRRIIQKNGWKEVR